MIGVPRSVSWPVSVAFVLLTGVVAVVGFRQAGTASPADRAGGRSPDGPPAILYVAGPPSYQYRFLKNALLRNTSFRVQFFLLSAGDGYRQEASGGLRPLTSLPVKGRDLARYGAIIVDGVGVALGEKQLTRWDRSLSHYVTNQGGSLITVAGAEYPQSLPADLLPVRLDQQSMRASPAAPFSVGLSAEAKAHLPSWANHTTSPLPGIYRYCRASPRPGSTVLVTVENAGRRDPLVVLSRAGRGFSLFIGSDELWRWRTGDGNLMAQFWFAVLSHMTRLQNRAHRNNVGKLLFVQKNYRQALALWEPDLEADVKKGTPDPGLLLLAAQAHFELRRREKNARSHHLDRAHALMRRVAEARPNDREVLAWRACLAYETGRYEEAIGIVERMLEIQPDQRNAQEFLLWLAQCYEKTGQTQKAANARNRAMRLRPPEAHPGDTARDSTMPPPAYPADARHKGLEGTVLLRALVARDGTIREVEVVSAEPPGVFEEAAVAAVSRWRLKPSQDETGRTMEAWQHLTLAFQLTGEAARVQPSRTEEDTVAKPLVKERHLCISIGGEKAREGEEADRFELTESLEDDDLVLARGLPDILKKLESLPPASRARISIGIGLSRTLKANVMTTILNELTRLGYSRVKISVVDPD